MQFTVLLPLVFQPSLGSLSSPNTPLCPGSEQELGDNTRKLPKENRLAPCNTRASPRWPQTHPDPICRVGMVHLPAAQYSHPSAVNYNATLCAHPRSGTPALPIFLIMHSRQLGNPPAMAQSQPQTVPKRLLGSPGIAVEDCQHPQSWPRSSPMDTTAVPGGAGTESHRDAWGHGDRALAPAALGRVPEMLKAALHPRLSLLPLHPTESCFDSPGGQQGHVCLPCLPDLSAPHHLRAQGPAREHSPIQWSCKGKQ